MSFPLEGPIPQIDLEPGAVVTIEAVDPTTGAAVAGVSFSSGIIYASGHAGPGGDLDSPQPHYLPVGPGGD